MKRAGGLIVFALTFSFLNNTPDLLIDRAYGFEGIDYFMIIGKLVIVFDLLGSYLVHQAPCSE